MSRRPFRLLVTALAALSLATSAAAQPQPAPQQRRAAILQAYGGAYEGPMVGYVSRVGARMAAAAGQGGRCTFNVINTEVVNAFASPPGCDVYITRGLLGLVRSEGELAAVLGHEVGHVAANHAGRRQTRSVITGLGALILGAVTRSNAIGQIAGQAGQLNVLSYSREQEFEADSLGARYLQSAGYSPYALADMLSALQANDQIEARSQGQDSKATPLWSRTHPLTGERIARAAAEARALVPPGAPPAGPADEGAAYLAAVDGLLWGDDPAQGFVEGRRFLHPSLGIGFQAPPGFTLSNSPSAVTLQGPGSLKAQFAGGRPLRGALEDEAYAVLRQLLGEAPAQAGRPYRTSVNGFEAVILPAQAQGASGVVDVTVAVYAVGSDAFHFVTLAPAGQAYAFDPLINSLHRLSAAERAQARPKRIRVVTVRPGDTVQSLAARMAVEDFPRERFEAINGLEPGDILRPGQRVKVVVPAT